MFFVFTLLASAALLVLQINRAYLYKQIVGNERSLIQGKSSRSIDENNWSFIFGKFVSGLISKQKLKELELDYQNLGRTKTELYQNLSYCAALCCISVLLYIYQANIFLLLLVVLAPASFLLELKLCMQQRDKEIARDSWHIVKCLQILVVQSSTPLANALKIINKDLPDHMQAIKLELNKIIQNANELGLEAALNKSNCKVENFKDLRSLMLSIQQGASNQAVHSNITALQEREQEEQLEKQKQEAENLQLYLLGPVLIMFLVVLSPMAAAINFMMKNSFNT